MSKRLLRSTQGTLACKPEKQILRNNSEKQEYFSRWEENPRQLFWVRPTESGFKQKV
jgi:ribosomal protein L24E